MFTPIPFMWQKSFYTNTSGCTDLIYHADLGTLWVLVWDSQTQGGQWSRCVYHKLCILGSAPFSNMFAWKFLVGRLCSCAAMMKPLGSDFRPDEASHLWVSEEFTSGSLARRRYLPWRGLSFHPSFSSLFFFGFCLCVNLFCFFSRCAIFKNVVSAKVNLNIFWHR